METFVAGKYALEEVLARGSFGIVWVCKEKSSGCNYALKVLTESQSTARLRDEARILQHLQGGTGIPRLHWFGQVGDRPGLVMDLLGGTLGSLHKSDISPGQSLSLFEAVVSRLEFVHSRSIVHRDIKPENFLLNNENLYIVDFGLAQSYRKIATNEHYPPTPGQEVVGTLRFMSRHAHTGLQQSRRDDLESAVYMFVFLLNGTLPWQGIKVADQAEKTQKVLECKVNSTPRDICGTLPGVFRRLVKYVRALEFEARPDYTLMRRLLGKAQQSLANSE